jgi:predicted Zn-dependent protease with MMP-like domain
VTPTRSALPLLAAVALIACSRAPDATAPAVPPAAPVVASPARAVDPSTLAEEAEQALDRGEAETALARADEALRALEVQARAPRRDRALEVRLLVAAAGAENDLGRSDLALPRAERAMRLAPRDSGAAWERALALWELCRFDEAEGAFQKVLSLSPDDPWALHHLGLAAERRGDRHRARELLAKASRIAPGDFPPEVPIDGAAFAAEVARAIASLPEPERRALAGVPLELADLPQADDLVAVEPPLSPSLLGLYRGPSEGEPCLPEDGAVCRSIVLYRKNLARFCRDRRELDRQIQVTLLHELGHFHGEDDDALRRRGLE